LLQRDPSASASGFLRALNAVLRPRTGHYRELKIAGTNLVIGGQVPCRDN
jgi:hypothetical protein